MSIIGKNISEFRRKKSITRESLSKQTGIKLHVLRELEYGSIPKNIGVVLPLIAKALGISLNQVFGIQNKREVSMTVAMEIMRLSKRLVRDLEV